VFFTFPLLGKNTGGSRGGRSAGRGSGERLKQERGGAGRREKLPFTKGEIVRPEGGDKFRRKKWKKKKEDLFE